MLVHCEILSSISSGIGIGTWKGEKRLEGTLALTMTFPFRYPAEKHGMGAAEALYRKTRTKVAFLGV